MKVSIVNSETGKEISADMEYRKDITLEQVNGMTPKLEIPNVTITSTVSCNGNKKLFEYLEVMKALAQLNKVKNYESKRID